MKQIDYMCVLQGVAKIVVYDDREGSPTRGLINEFTISDDNLTLIGIPGEC
jgi:dTDP-4-dehydrorhamnose 3,5-epimerase